MATRSAPAKSPVPSFVMAAGNALFPLLLRSRFHGILSKNMMLLSFKGRKSGKVYTFPVGYTRDGDTVELVSNHGWWKNLRDHAPVTLWLKGQKRSGIAHVFHGDEDVLVNAFVPLAQKSPQLRHGS
jgi:deazaflavin-dependent oxidoreductase (nitroreductase family)